MSIQVKPGAILYLHHDIHIWFFNVFNKRDLGLMTYLKYLLATITIANRTEYVYTWYWCTWK